MNLRPFAIITLLLLASCGLMLSPDEKASVKEIVTIWGGTCSYKVSSSISTGKGKRKTLELVLENSPAVNAGKVPQDIITSSMALTMYEGWTEEQRSSYTHVVATVKYDGGAFEKEYPVAQLKDIAARKPLFHEYAGYVQHHDIKELLRHMAPRFYTDSNVTELKRIAAKEDSLYGPVQQDKLLGYRFSREKIEGNEIDLLYLYGVMERSKEQIRFILAVDTSKSQEEYYLYYVNF